MRLMEQRVRDVLEPHVRRMTRADARLDIDYDLLRNVAGVYVTCVRCRTRWMAVEDGRLAPLVSFSRFIIDDVLPMDGPTSVSSVEERERVERDRAQRDRTRHFAARTICDRMLQQPCRCWR